MIVKLKSHLYQEDLYSFMGEYLTSNKYGVRTMAIFQKCNEFEEPLTTEVIHLPPSMIVEVIPTLGRK